jgi:hypothetical protein
MTGSVSAPANACDATTPAPAAASANPSATFTILPIRMTAPLCGAHHEIKIAKGG